MVTFNNGIPGQPKNERELRRAFQKLRELQQSGDDGFITPYTAGQIISGDRVVRVSAGQVFIADNTTATPGSVVGLSVNAAQLGAIVNVRSGGKASGFSGLTPGAKYFLGTTGAITTTRPTTGILQVIGVAQDASTLVVQIGPAIVLT